VLHLLGAIDRLESRARADVARSTVDELSGARALELLVEVAHDMRSPLGSILFLVERLRGLSTVTADAQAGRALGLVYGAAFGLSSMVGDVMELARGGDRLAGGEPEPLSLASVVEEVRAIVEPIAEEKRLALVVHPAPREPRVGHPAALQRVLLNLVTNALKFTPQGEVSLRVTSEGAARVRFEIQDTGPGIPAAVQAQLFRAFRPRATGEGTAFSSAGLGLAICRKLIARMGGQLAVDSSASVHALRLRARAADRARGAHVLTARARTRRAGPVAVSRRAVPAAPGARARSCRRASGARAWPAWSARRRAAARARRGAPGARRARASTGSRRGGACRS
jgi:signal transduction histidine kinase